MRIIALIVIQIAQEIEKARRDASAQITGELVFTVGDPKWPDGALLWRRDG